MRSSTFEKDRFKESTYERVGPTKRIKISISLKSDFSFGANLESLKIKFIGNQKFPP